MRTKFNFVEKSLGLMAGGIFAWFTITTMIVLGLGIMSKTFAVIGLYFFGLFAIPVAIITSLISGHIVWAFADFLNIQGRLGLFLIGSLNGLLLLVLFAVCTDGTIQLSLEIFIYLTTAGIVGGLTALFARNQAESFKL